MSYGVDKWHYHVFTDTYRGQARDYFQDLSNECDSEQHRGYEWQKVSSIPTSILEERIRDEQSSIRNCRKHLRLLKTIPTHRDYSNKGY